MVPPLDATPVYCRLVLPSRSQVLIYSWLNRDIRGRRGFCPMSQHPPTSIQYTLLWRRHEPSPTHLHANCQADELITALVKPVFLNAELSWTEVFDRTKPVKTDRCSNLWEPLGEQTVAVDLHKLAGGEAVGETYTQLVRQGFAQCRLPCAWRTCVHTIKRPHFVTPAFSFLIVEKNMSHDICCHMAYTHSHINVQCNKSIAHTQRQTCHYVQANHTNSHTQVCMHSHTQSRSQFDTHYTQTRLHT